MPTTTTHIKVYWLDGTTEEFTTTNPIAVDDADHIVFTDGSGHKHDINKKATKRVETWSV